MTAFEWGGLIGNLVAGFMFTAIFAGLIEFAGFRNQEPMARAILTVSLGYLMAAALRTYIASRTGNEQWTHFLLFIPGAVLVFLWSLRRYRKAWRVSDEDG